MEPLNGVVLLRNAARDRGDVERVFDRRSHWSQARWKLVQRARAGNVVCYFAALPSFRLHQLGGFLAQDTLGHPQLDEASLRPFQERRPAEPCPAARAARVRSATPPKASARPRGSRRLSRLPPSRPASPWGPPSR